MLPAQLGSDGDDIYIYSRIFSYYQGVRVAATYYSYEYCVKRRRTLLYAYIFPACLRTGDSNSMYLSGMTGLVFVPEVASNSRPH